MDCFQLTNKNKTPPKSQFQSGSYIGLRRLQVPDINRRYIICLDSKVKEKVNLDHSLRSSLERLEEKKITLSSGESKARIIFDTDNHFDVTNHICPCEFIEYFSLYEIREKRFHDCEWAIDIVVSRTTLTNRKTGWPAIERLHPLPPQVSPLDTLTGEFNAQKAVLHQQLTKIHDTISIHERRIAILYSEFDQQEADIVEQKRDLEEQLHEIFTSLDGNSKQITALNGYHRHCISKGIEFRDALDRGHNLYSYYIKRFLFIVGIQMILIVYLLFLNLYPAM